VALAVGFVLAPLLLRHLGVDRFGFWSLIWAITGSLALVDLRIGAAITRYAADAWTRGEVARLSRLATTGLAFYIVLGLVEVAGALALLILPTRAPFELPAAVAVEGGPALALAVAVFALNSAGSVFVGVLQGLQRFDLTALVAVAGTCLRAAGVLAVLGLGGGLRELVLVEGAIALFQGLLSYFQTRRLLPELRLVPSGVVGAVFKELGAFGLKLQVAHLAFLASFHGDKLLLSFFLGLPAVAFYDLGSKVAYLMRGFPLLLVSAVGPEASALAAGGNRARLWALYLKGTAYLVAAGTPLLVFTVVGAGPILRVWLGSELPEARQAIQVLAVGYYANLLSGMAYTVAVGIGKPELEMRRSLLVTVLNLVLSACLIPLIGFVGAPLGTTVALIAGTIYLIGRFHAEFAQPLSTFVPVLRGPALLALPTAGAAWLLLQGGHRLGEGFWISALALALAGVVIAAAYLALAIRQGVVAPEDLQAVQAWLGGR
jgi:O-antigen/teichoic acid export membrane protein